VSVLGDLTNFMASGVATLGYPGIFLFMFIEGAITPIPSVVIVPFAGALAAGGTMSLPVVVAVASLGTMAGSGVAYHIGLRLGRPFVLKYGRYLFLDESDLVRAESWFRRWGIAGVFLANCFAGSRSIVAYPAGAGRMAFAPFLIATFGGALIWNSVLAAAGFLLFREWRRIVDTFELIDLVAILAVLGGVGAWVWYKKRITARPAPETP
jgi:membrane protein DedA with SNARE-associated domain